MGSNPALGTSAIAVALLQGASTAILTSDLLMTNVATEYETVIGLEVHAQLLTKSKMYCPCSADYADSPPNTHVCPVCLGMPGVLPVINRQAVEYTIMTALALNCQIAEVSRFDRKNYPYPDLMKGYQISQYDMPFSHDGWLEIDADGETERIGITRVHLEEDVARLVHVQNEAGETFVFTASRDEAAAGRRGLLRSLLRLHPIVPLDASLTPTARVEVEAVWRHVAEKRGLEPSALPRQAEWYLVVRRPRGKQKSGRRP